MHEINIETIQNETLKIIQVTQDLLSEAENLNTDKKQVSTTNKESLDAYKNTLDNETKKLKNLEFVIAVVGTMKAGKSTTINAIVGKEVLPNRAFPMTALPTLVTHKLGQTEPKLTLPKFKPLLKLLDKIKNALSDDHKGEFIGSKDGKELQLLIKNKKIEFKEKYYGQDEIFYFLKTLNDLMRTAKDLNIEPPYEEFSHIDELPRIEVEFYHLKHIKNISEARLSILDTPGPNEFKHSTQLQKIFKTQLHQASAIMLVMDYTVMNSQSDGTVRDQIKEITDLIGKERMFVLLNKFDEKGKNDSDYDETIDHVSKHLLNNQVPMANIYPVSSKIAFLVNRGLSEIEEKGSLDLNSPWVEDFGNEIIGRRWKKTIDNIDEVKELCKEAWDEDSYFEKPLDNIIIHAHAKAAVGSISGTLNKLLKISKDLDNAFKTRENALTKNILALKSSIEKLQEDISKVGDISESINADIEKNLSDIQFKLKQLTEGQLSLAQRSILHVFELKEKLEKEEEEESMNTPNHEFRRFLNMFNIFSSEKSKSHDNNIEELIEEGKITFDSKGEAKDFTYEIQELLEKSIEYVLDNSEETFKSEIKQFIPLVNDNIKDKLGNLIEKMQEKMGGNIDITTPEIIFTKDGISIKGSLTDSIESETVTKSKSVVTNGFTNFFNNNWGRETKYYDVTTFTITKSDIENNVKEIFHKVVNIIENNAEDIYANNIQNVVFESLENLTYEIEGYRGEMLNVLKGRESDEIDIETEKASAQKNQEQAQGIIKRVSTTQKELEKMESKNE